jgi:predicted AlkP superfamily pyrophosphatase or phosphodiesterase
MKSLHFLALGFLCSALGVEAETPSAKARNVVVIVWDGMRPDFVSKEQTPVLWKFAREGVMFRHHHSSYLSATVVNSTAIATGCYPSGSGLFANYVFRPEISPLKFLDAGEPSIVRKRDALSGGKYLTKPTIAEILHGAGKRTAIAGTKFVTLMHDRRDRAENDAARKSGVLFQGATWPDQLIAALSSMLGPFPGIDDEGSDHWTTRALIDGLWKDGVPEYSLIWLRDPDHMEHKTAPGSPASLAAVKRSDNRLAEILSALKKRNLRQNTDVFVVSDHGFSTIERSVDLLPLLNRAGFRAFKEFPEPPRDGEIMVVGNGGSVLFYVIGHDSAISERLVAWLQQSDFAGVIFSRAKIEGTFSLADAKIDTSTAPDVVLSFRWNDKPNEFGVRGMINADWNRKAGAGTHATLSPFDMNSTLIAAGPDFRQGITDELPSGNVDLAPTILSIFGIAPAEKMDGRILSEAMREGEEKKAQSNTITAKRQFEQATWQQYLRISRVDSTFYFDEGIGFSQAR